MVSAAPRESAGSPLQLALFDDRRAAREEDDPAEQLLAFHPAATPRQEQASAVGLARAVMAFTSIFTEDGASELAMDAQQHRWVAHAAEPHLCLLLVHPRPAGTPVSRFLVADASWCGSLVRDAALHSVLLQVHAAIRLLHGSIQRLLDKAPLEDAREALSAILGHYGGALAKGGAPHVLEIANPLSAAGGIPFFPLSRRTFTGLQALCDGLLLLPLRPGGGGGGAVAGIVAMHGRHCLWSSAGREDTAALASLAAGALAPHARGGESAWKKLKGAALATAGRHAFYLSPSQAKRQPSRLPLDPGAWAAADSGFLQSAAVGRNPGPDPAPSPRSNGSARGSAAGSAGGSGAATPAELHLPTVHLQGGDACQLLPLQQGEALLLLLMGEDWAPSADARRSMAAAAAAPLQRLGAAVAAEIAAAHDGHVKGFRYLHTDGVLSAARASPAVKTATLARESAALTASVRRQLDERVAAQPGPAEDADVEMVARGADDCWVAGRVAGPRSLVVVMEGRGEGGLQEASVTAARFATEHFPGKF